MADAETAELLENWGLSSLINLFRDNCIDVIALKDLSEADICDLIKLIGVRAKFRANWKHWLAIRSGTAEEKQDQSYTVLDISKNILMGSGGCDASFSSQKTLLISSGDELNFTEENISTETGISLPPSSPYSEHEKSSLNEELPMPKNSPFDPNYVEVVLRESRSGISLLGATRNAGLLSANERRRLARIIIDDAIETFRPTFIIPTSVLARLATQISRLFSKENPCLYYTGSQAATKFQPKKNASGALYEAYITRRKILIKDGIIKKRPHSRSSCMRSPLPDKDQSLSFDIEDNPVVEERLNWLRNSVHPWDLVDVYWRETQEHRLRILDQKTSYVNICAYFNEYPALKQRLGYLLLVDDFSFKYSEAVNGLYDHIIHNRDIILSIACERKQKSRDQDYKNQLEKYMNIVNDDWHDSKTVAALLVLPYLLSLPKTGSKAGKQPWKPSRAEVRDAFIAHIPSESQLTPTIEARKCKYESLNRTFQPLVVIIGEQINQLAQAAVVIDSTVYRLTSPVEAVDTAFKIFHSTGACYPEEATDVWLFIQRGFYKITTKFDRMTQSIRHLMTDLGIHH